VLQASAAVPSQVGAADTCPFLCRSCEAFCGTQTHAAASSTAARCSFDTSSSPNGVRHIAGGAHLNQLSTHRAACTVVQRTFAAAAAQPLPQADATATRNMWNELFFPTPSPKLFADAANSTELRQGDVGSYYALDEHRIAEAFEPWYSNRDVKAGKPYNADGGGTVRPLPSFSKGSVGLQLEFAQSYYPYLMYRCVHSDTSKAFEATVHCASRVASSYNLLVSASSWHALETPPQALVQYCSAHALLNISPAHAQSRIAHTIVVQGGFCACLGHDQDACSSGAAAHPAARPAWLWQVCPACCHGRDAAPSWLVCVAKHVVQTC
jgi:hypothetical protein